MTNKKIMLVWRQGQSGIATSATSLATAVSSGSNESKTTRALLSWLQKVGYAGPLAEGPKSSRLKFRLAWETATSRPYDRALRRTCLSWVRGCSLAIGAVEVRRTCQDPQNEEPKVGETQAGNDYSNRGKE